VLAVIVLGGLVSGIAALPSIGSSSASRIEDDEERDYERALAQRSFDDNCLICHSAEMTTQQRLTPAQWKAEVEKMIGWGAPVPADQTQRLIDYLAAEYASQKALAVPHMTSPEDAFGLDEPEAHNEIRAGDAKAGSTLYAANCANCHGADGQGGDLGPNLVERPVLQRTDEFTRFVRDGVRRMPGYRAVLTPSQEADVLGWLRGRTYQPARP
jgi:ubiquinol-cytochrome c reductase cytochrome c subunit